MFMPALSGKNGAIVVYDITNLQSFLNAKNWIKLVRSKSGSDVVITLLGNKLDEADSKGKREVNRDKVETFCFENSITFSETCAINKTSTITIERLVKKLSLFTEIKKSYLSILNQL